MSGLLRNLITIICALFLYRRKGSQTATHASFRITPFDVGLATLKSDKYLQLAESAQFDFLIQTGLIRRLISQNISFVNIAQLVRFSKPIRLFDRVDCETQIVFADDKLCYFSHHFFVRNILHAQVLVKMKFKKGGLTVSPLSLLDMVNEPAADKPVYLEKWDAALSEI